MTESLIHRHLVGRIVDYIQCQYSEGFLFIDDGMSDPPFSIGEGYRPDVLYQTDELIIIGEAKTEWDLETNHSRMQLRSYFEYSLYSNLPVVILLAVPWVCKASANNMMMNFKRSISNKVEVKIIIDQDVMG